MIKIGAVLLNSISPEAMEAMAASVHQAYLDTCARLGWEVREDNKVPYEKLEENSKELDRASVRAVAVFLLQEVKKSADKTKETEDSWRDCAKLTEHYKRAVSDYAIRFRNMKEELDKRGISLCAACRGEGGTTENVSPGLSVPKLCPICRGTGLAPSMADLTPQSQAL